MPNNYIMMGNNDQTTFNYSIAFMKAFFSFCVVLCHFWNNENLDVYVEAMLLRMQNVAVPVFFLISFYLTAGTFKKLDLNKFKVRMHRLLIPYIIWPIIYFVGYIVIDFLLKQVGVEKGLGVNFSIRDLLWQLLMGADRHLCSQLWYMFDLMLVSVLFLIIFYLFSEQSSKILVVLLILALWLQYSGINMLCFGGLIHEMRYSLGRIAEVIPFACVGMLLNTDIMSYLKRHWLYVDIICFFTMLIISYYSLLTSLDDSFGYAGTYIMGYGVLAFVMFYVFPFEKMPVIIRKSIIFLAKYSFGVYCVHLGVGSCLGSLWYKLGLRLDTFPESLSIYFISLTICYIISKIPYGKKIVE